MRIGQRVIFSAFALTVITQADVIILKTGGTVKGDLQSADASVMRVKSGDNILTYSINDVASIIFEPRTGGAPASTIHVPSGTIVIRTIDAIDSRNAQVGQTFTASLDEPFAVNGAAIPRGAPAILKLVEARSAGRLTGSAELTLVLVSITSGGKTYETNTESVISESATKGKSSAGKIGLGTGLGAAIGGVIGGGKGAAVGAGAGAAAGTALAITTGPQVKIPSETRLSFKVQ